jgi:putative tricarboxylic transport membrane protein
MNEEGPGPGFFPMWYGGSMVVLSLLLVAGTVMKRASQPTAVQWGDLGRALGCWAGFTASIAAMPVIGFPISFALLTWFIVAVMARQPQRLALPISIGGALVFYALFEWALDVGLPKGILF